MESGYSVDLITQHSIDFLARHKDEPFFLYVAHLAIHFPWQGPDHPPHRVKGHDYWNLSKLGPHPQGQVGPVVRRMVESLDASVGRIMAALKRLGLDENTLVFLASDNGGYLDYDNRFAGEISSNGPLRGQKGDVFEGGHRVPAIARWPGRIEAGAVTRQTAITMDLLPTCANLAGVTTPPPTDGLSLSPLLLDGAPLPPRDLFWRKDHLRAVRRGPWKLVTTPEETHLFNLDQDLPERHDLAPHHPKLVASLLASLQTWQHSIDRNEPHAHSDR